MRSGHVRCRSGNLPSIGLNLPEGAPGTLAAGARYDDIAGASASLLSRCTDTDTDTPGVICPSDRDGPDGASGRSQRCAAGMRVRLRPAMLAIQSTASASFSFRLVPLPHQCGIASVSRLLN